MCPNQRGLCEFMNLVISFWQYEPYFAIHKTLVDLILLDVEIPSIALSILISIDVVWFLSSAIPAAVSFCY